MSAFLPPRPSSKVIHFTPLFLPRFPFFLHVLRSSLARSLSLALSLSPVAFRIHSFSIRITIIICTRVPRATEQRRRADDEWTTVNARGGGAAVRSVDAGLPGPTLAAPTSAADWSNLTGGRMLLLGDADASRQDAGRSRCASYVPARAIKTAAAALSPSRVFRMQHPRRRIWLLVTSHALVPRIA